MKRSKTQLDVLRKMAGGKELYAQFVTVHRTTFHLTGSRVQKPVNLRTFEALLNAKMIEHLESGRLRYVITPAGRAAVEGAK